MRNFLIGRKSAGTGLAEAAEAAGQVWNRAEAGVTADPERNLQADAAQCPEAQAAVCGVEDVAAICSMAAADHADNTVAAHDI